MRNIPFPDAHFLRAAMGWTELGNFAEAEAELAQIKPAFRRHPDYLMMRWLVASERKDWPACLELARQLLVRVPKDDSGWIHQAYAMRRVYGGKAGVLLAYRALLPGARQCPKSLLVHFNLACYSAQLSTVHGLSESLAEAWEWFEKAVKVGGVKPMKSLALAEKDLEPLWGRIKEL
jgi:predicted Zn-dependent protease